MIKKLFMKDHFTIPYGESHNYKLLISQWRDLCKVQGWKFKKFAMADGLPCYQVFSKGIKSANAFYLSAGIHGDEAVGSLALLSWANKRSSFLSKQPTLIYPCLNPWGLCQNSRSDRSGDDLNRQWNQPKSPVIQEIVKRSREMRFSLAINLHEDFDANGIYLYENPTANFKDNKATEILRAGKVHIPIDKRKKIEGRWSRNGIIRPSKSSLPKEGLPEAVFLQENIAERTFVWETPSEMDIRIRVKAHIAMLDEALGYTIS